MAFQTKTNLPFLDTVVKHTLLSPYITGPLLLYVTKLNPSILDKIPWFPDITLALPSIFNNNNSNSNNTGNNSPSTITLLRAAPPLKTLKWLFGIGLVIHVNRALNRLALNYWHLKKQGPAWDFQTEGKETIIITGGCSGFGREMVKMFAAQTKSNIVVLDVQELPDDMKSIPRLTYHQIDLSSNESINSTIASLLSSSSSSSTTTTPTVPTVLINNAGIAQAHTILHTSDAFLEKIFRINVLSHFTLIRLILPSMLANKKGHIVSLASMASYTGVANLADYAATKAAVLALHESLVQELAHNRYGPDGHCIQASIIHPLWARTPLITSWEHELTRAKQPVLSAEQVASRVVGQVLSGRSGSVYIPEKQVIGSLLRVVPDWLALAVRAGIHSATATKKRLKR
ncbi:hypothetical protein LTS15_006209 [Exophiala xenobiotica]|nr:hypothetical protein LTS15_006209 [Exophiala xenobiotica]